MTGWFVPGSIPWLLAHEMRLNLRTYFTGKRRWSAPVALLVLMVLLSVSGWTMAIATSKAAMTVSAPVALIVMMCFLFMTSIQLAQALAMVVRLFFERGDYDLLLASPVPPQRILFVRGVGLALSVSALYLFMAIPFVLPFAVLVAPQMLLSLLFLLALGLVGTSFGLWLAMVLFALIGVRRTKTIGMVLSAVIGAAVFLFSQLAGQVPSVRVWLSHFTAHSAASFTPDVWWAIPLRAVYGDVLINLMALVLAGGLFWFSTWIFGRRFPELVAVASVADSRPARRAGAVRFGNTLRRSLLHKEWMLIRRDPTLLSQALMQILYLVPLCFVVLKSVEKAGAVPGAASAHLGAMLAGMLVLFACQLASELAWIAISAEDAPDLLTAAPVSPDTLRKAKLDAVLTMVFVVFALPLAGLLVYAPWAGLVAIAGCYLGIVSVGYINLWFERPQPRRNFLRRGQGDVVVTLGQFFFGVACMAVVILVALGSFWALLVVLVPVAMLGGFYGLRRHDV